MMRIRFRNTFCIRFFASGRKYIVQIRPSNTGIKLRLYSEDTDPINEIRVDLSEERSLLTGKIFKSLLSSLEEIISAKKKTYLTRFLINAFRSLFDVMQKVIKKKSDTCIIALRQSLKINR
jgi:hypothetical protein